MASNTPNLNLLKKDPVVDGNDTFNIETMLNENWDKIDTGVGNKVDKVAGKQLSDTNYTIDEKMKLENVEVGANKTTIADNLTTNDSAKVLSAKQGFTLNVIIGSLSSLTTAIKTSIVNAINSLKTEVDEHKADSVSAHGLNNKVDKVAGKQLSDTNYTINEKMKLEGIETGANKYVHPTSHPASMITGLPNSLPATYGNIVSVSSSITLGSTHSDKVLDCTNAAAITITVPTILDVGTQITVIRRGAGVVTFAPAAGVTLNSKDTKRAIAGQHASATLVKVTSTIWQLIGALE